MVLILIIFLDKTNFSKDNKNTINFTFNPADFHITNKFCENSTFIKTLRKRTCFS